MQLPIIGCTFKIKDITSLKFSKSTQTYTLILKEKEDMDKKTLIEQSQINLLYMCQYFDSLGDQNAHKFSGYLINLFMKLQNFDY